MSALRIYVVTPAFPPEVGGQEMHLYELSESLIASGVAVTVVTRRLQPSFARRELVGTVPVLRLAPLGEARGGGWGAVWPLTRLLANIAYRLLKDARLYDVVLVSGFNILPFAAVMAALITRKPCVVRPESPLEVRDAIGGESRAKMGLSHASAALKLFLAWRRWVAGRVDGYIAISSEIKQGLLDLGIDAARIVAIPNGIDTARFGAVTSMRRRDLRSALGLPLEGKLLIYTGRIVRSKGVLMLIDIWRELVQTNADMHLVIVGTGLGSTDDCEEELRAFVAAHRFTDRVSLVGNKTNVNEYLQACDIFVFPSDSEGFGLSILEAMSVGLPIVSTRVGVAADLAAVPEVALLVPPRDRAGFKEALQRLLADPTLQFVIGSRAREAVQAQYSMSAVARRHIEVLSAYCR